MTAFSFSSLAMAADWALCMTCPSFVSAKKPFVIAYCMIRLVRLSSRPTVFAISAYAISPSRGTAENTSKRYSVRVLAESWCCGSSSESCLLWSARNCTYRGSDPVSSLDRPSNQPLEQHDRFEKLQAGYVSFGE